MPWIYVQSTGELSRDGQIVATGYSGWGPVKNSLVAEGVALWGPIPRGKWRIEEPTDSAAQGLVCFRLRPLEATQVFGRSGFLIREDRGEPPGNASHGSIILPRPARLAIAESADRELEVI